MTITELYNRMCDKNFQDPATGNLFSNAYMYLYDSTQENQIRNEIQTIKERLIRPDVYQDILILDIFELFCQHLKQKKFGQKTLFDFFLEREAETPDKVNDSLVREAKSNDFFAFINQNIKEHLNTEGENKKSYVTIHGFGAIFPYLRTSKFISNFEKYFIGEKYKLIIFYPGEVKDFYSLFNLLNDEHPYRAIKLIS
ncbi:MAG TPA: DUF1788 domain-containing protein [Prolixibacteraceae bacterium]|nr:DUF1788 domain-containing protein [Prolixibacteraceae bacterium]